LQITPDDSIVSLVAPKGKQTRSTPQLSLARPEDDPENIIRKGKTPQEEISAIVSGDSSNLHHYLKNPVVSSHSPIIRSVGVSRSLNFKSFLIEFSPSRPHLEEIFNTPVSPKIVKLSRPKILEGCPTLGFPTPPPFIVTTSKEGKLLFPSPLEEHFQSHLFKLHLPLVLLQFTFQWQVLILLKMGWMP
jgi:hypothetical protein